MTGIPGIAGGAHGQVVLSGAALRLLEQIDGAFVRLAGRWRSEHLAFPPFLPARDLERIGYFGSFPHQATFPVAAPNDAEALRAFAASPLRASDDSVDLPAGTGATEVLSPAACYHIYVHLAGAELADTRHFTTKSTCYRRESAYRPLLRQWAFTMREIVCVGDRGGVDAFLEAAEADLTSAYAELGVGVTWQPASDPFFGGRNDPRSLMQRITGAKQEAVFDGGAEEPGVALASVNRHGQLFGTAFGILDARGAPAHSGCVGVGLERALFAVVSAHGPDPANWPVEAVAGPAA